MHEIVHRAVRARIGPFLAATKARFNVRGDLSRRQQHAPLEVELPDGFYIGAEDLDRAQRTIVGDRIQPRR